MKHLLPILLLLGCTKPVSFPTPVLPNDADCPTAMDNIERLECHELLAVAGPDEIPGNEDDYNWVSYCWAMQTSGIVELDLICVVGAEDCETIEDCLND